MAESPVTSHQSRVWDGLTSEALAHRCGVDRLELLDVTDSVLDVAHTLAEQGVPAGTVVLADTQRAGRGRMGRAWSSEPGLGVWCAVIQRSLTQDSMDVLSLRIGLEIAERLDTLARDPVGVKWPNDLVIGSAKLGGILVEARWSGDTLAWIAIGVGVNVVRPISETAAAGMPKGTARADVLAAVVAGCRAAVAATGHLSQGDLARYRARDVLRGKRIVEPVSGTVSGIAANGALVVETRRGTERVRTGTIRLAEGR